EGWLSAADRVPDTLQGAHRTELIQETVDMKEVLLRFLPDEQDHERDARLPERQCALGAVVAACRDGDEPELEHVRKEQQERALAGQLECDLTDHAVREQHECDDALESRPARGHNKE